MEGEIIFADIGCISLLLDTLASERKLEDNFKGESQLASLNIFSKDSDVSLQIIIVAIAEI